MSREHMEIYTVVCDRCGKLKAADRVSDPYNWIAINHHGNERHLCELCAVDRPDWWPRDVPEFCNGKPISGANESRSC